MSKKRAPGRSLDEWMELVTECRQSGLTDAAWCNEHGISDENKTYSISALCEFAGIARSAYYKWLGHVNSDNDNLNERIADTITKIHDEHPDIGYRRIRDTLAHDYKIAVNDKRVLRICRKKKIQSYIKHRYNCCTKPASDPAYVAENILNREFKSDMM